VQLPIFGMLYSTIRNALTANSRFLWIRNLAAPDFVLTLVSLPDGTVAYWMPMASENARTTMIVIQTDRDFADLWSSRPDWAFIGIFEFCGLFQTLWLRYRVPPDASSLSGIHADEPPSSSYRTGPSDTIVGACLQAIPRSAIASKLAPTTAQLFAEPDSLA